MQQHLQIYIIQKFSVPSLHTIGNVPLSDKPRDFIFKTVTNHEII